MAVTRADLDDDLRAIGLESDDAVIVHSSLSRVGWVEGGPDVVVDALLAVIGTAGTVAMPTFTFGREPFDREHSPSATGSVTEALRSRPDAVRSPHPTHSVAVVGPDAGAVTADHDPMATFGAESPLYRLIEEGAKLLLIGVDNRRNSSIHVAEQLVGVPHKRRTRDAPVRAPDGTVRTVEIASPECGRGFHHVEPAAEAAGLVRHGTVGAAPSQLLDGPGLLACAVGVLSADPGALLCTDDACPSCTRARRILSTR